MRLARSCEGFQWAMNVGAVLTTPMLGTRLPSVCRRCVRALKQRRPRMYTKHVYAILRNCLVPTRSLHLAQNMV